MQYAEPRFTKDLDLLIATNEENSEAVYNALREFGAPLSGLTAKDFAEDGFFLSNGCSAYSRGCDHGNSRGQF